MSAFDEIRARTEEDRMALNGGGWIGDDTCVGDKERLIAAVDAVEKGLDRMDLAGYTLTCASDKGARMAGTRLRREASKIRDAINAALEGDR
jgi:hypothetical protein